MMPARTTWYYLKEHLKDRYLTRESENFFTYHRSVAESMVSDKYHQDWLVKQCNKYELIERFLMSSSRAFFDTLGLVCMIDSSVSNSNTAGYAIASLLAGQVVPEAIKRYLKPNREETQSRTRHTLRSAHQDKDIAAIVNMSDPKPIVPEKGYLDAERERYGEFGRDDSGEEWKK